MYKAFNLAEVVITLGSLGIIATMTIPTLISKYKEKEALDKLKSFYSVFNQAIKLSEVQNGSISSWKLAEGNNYSDNQDFFNTYLKDSFRYTEIKNVDLANNQKGIMVYLNNGTSFVITKDEIIFYSHPELENQIEGRDIFYFRISTTDTKGAIKPYRGTEASRTSYLQDAQTHCGFSENYQRKDCAGLIIKDGWQILDDYPVKF